MYLALGINLHGKKELLGMWLSDTDKKKVAFDVNAIYDADTLEIEEDNLQHFDEVWGESYPHMVES